MNDPVALPPSPRLAGVEVGSDCEQAAPLWRTAEAFSSCLGLLTRPKPEIRAWKGGKTKGRFNEIVKQAEEEEGGGGGGRLGWGGVTK